MNPISKFFEARRRRLGIHDLKALPPELLRDIGIEPDRIHAIVAGVQKEKRTATRRAVPHVAGPGLSNSTWPYPCQRAR